jgi:hypothetical protein
MKYLLRIITLPVVAFIGLIALIRLWAFWCTMYVRHGGEMVVHAKNSRETLADLFVYLEEKKHEDNNKSCSCHRP